jgi:hypothetical protein
MVIKMLLDSVIQKIVQMIFNFEKEINVHYVHYYKNKINNKIK